MDPLRGPQVQPQGTPPQAVKDEKLQSKFSNVNKKTNVLEGFSRTIENIKILFQSAIGNIKSKGVNFRARLSKPSADSPLEREYKTAANEIRSILQDRNTSNDGKAISIYQVTNRMLAKEAELNPEVAQGGADLSREIVGKLASKLSSSSVRSRLDIVLKNINENTLNEAIGNSSLIEEAKTAMLNDLAKQTGNSTGTLKRRQAQINDLGPEDISPNVQSRLEELQRALKTR